MKPPPPWSKTARRFSPRWSRRRSRPTRKYGGVVPELASREHLRAIVPGGARSARPSPPRAAEISPPSPSRPVPDWSGRCWSALTYAKALCFATGMPLIARKPHRGPHPRRGPGSQPRRHPVELPALALVVSGGHTHLFEVREGFHYRLLGKTRDDAAGEAFDKVAKLLGFGYPGGPVIDRLAPHGDPTAVRIHLRQDERQHARFQLQRPQDRRPALGGSARSGRGNRRPPRAARSRSAAPAVDEWLAVTPAANARPAGFVPAHRDSRIAAPRPPAPSRSARAA